jgi:nitrite reductase/ring-hydroxylating ferredoxin subunit
MKQERQIAIADRLFRHIDAMSTDRATAEMFIRETDYTDAGVAQRERSDILMTHPHVAAPSSELAQPGDFITVNVMGVPIIVARQDDGSVRAFRNVCRHRCATVVDAQKGHRRQFTCPYHGWTYELHGALRTVPDGEASFPAIDKKKFGLIDVPVAERHGLIWVVPAAGTNLDLKNFLGAEIDEDLAQIGLDGFHLYRTGVFEQPVNWKLLMDGFLEVYHVRYLHATTLSRIAISNVLVVDALERHLRLVSARKDIEKLRDAKPEALNLLPGIILTYILMPSTVIVYVRDHFEIWSIAPHATDPAKSTVTLRFLIPKAVEGDKESAYWDKNWNTVVSAVDAEDWAAARGIQGNLSRDKTSGGECVFGRNEIGLQHFHRYLASSPNRLFYHPAQSAGQS